MKPSARPTNFGRQIAALDGLPAVKVKTQLGMITPPSHLIVHFGKVFFSSSIPAPVTFALSTRNSLARGPEKAERTGVELTPEPVNKANFTQRLTQRLLGAA